MTPSPRPALFLAGLVALGLPAAAGAQAAAAGADVAVPVAGSAAPDAAGAAAAPRAAPSAADLATLEQRRSDTYDRFRALVAEGRYVDAIPLAKEVLQLTETIDPNHDDLPTAWNNLGVAQLRASDPKAALDSFSRSLDILERTKGIGSRRLIAPMAGLGASYNALGEPAKAAEQFERAISVSRRAAGLFNLEQLDLMDALIQAYAAVGYVEGIERERRYALQIVEKRFGYGDPRALPRLTQLAEWYEATGRYAPARLLYKRALEVAAHEGGGRNTATIDALLAIARTHRLQYAEDPESMIQVEETMPRYAESIAGRPVSRVQAAPPVAAVQAQNQPRVKMDPEGKVALDQAIDLLESSSDPPAALMSRALVEQGDWHMTAGNTAEGLASYAKAWPLLESVAATGVANPLAAPRRLLYRAPSGQRRSRLLSGGELVESRGDFRVDVSAEGQPVLVEPAGGNLSKMQASQVVRALRRSIFSPAFVDGKPVATTSHRLSETWFEFAKDYEERSGGGAGAAGGSEDAAGGSAGEDASPAGTEPAGAGAAPPAGAAAPEGAVAPPAGAEAPPGAGGEAVPPPPTTVDVPPTGI
jgi:tetratricopeptide (TPR) repeat protein